MQYAWEVGNTYLEIKRKRIQIKHTTIELASTAPSADLKSSKNTWTAVCRFHFNSCFEDPSKVTTGVLCAALRSTAEGHGRHKHFSVHTQWNHPQRVKSDNSDYPSKNSPILEEECGRDLPNCDNECSTLIPTEVSRRVANKALVPKIFIVHTIIATTRISCSQKS